jgi:transcriptional regulator with XRE-family HTH domain
MTDDEMEVAGRVGAALKKLRKAHGMTQQELSERAGIGRNYVAYLEAGKRVPSVGMVATLARILGVDVGELFGAAPESNDQERIVIALFRAMPSSQKRTAVAVLKAL